MCSLNGRAIECRILQYANRQTSMEARVWRNLVPRPKDTQPSAMHVFSLQHHAPLCRKRKRLVCSRTDDRLESDCETSTDRLISAEQTELSVALEESSPKVPIPMNVRDSCDCADSIDTFDMLLEMYRQIRDRQLPETMSLSPMECNVLAWSSKYLERVKDSKCVSLGRFLDLMRHEAVDEADLDSIVQQTAENRGFGSTDKAIAALSASIAERRAVNTDQTRSSPCASSTLTAPPVRTNDSNNNDCEKVKEAEEDVIDPHIACGQDIYEALVRYHGGWFRPDIKYTSWDRMTRRVMARRANCASTSSVAVPLGDTTTTETADNSSRPPETPSLTDSATRRATMSPPARLLPTIQRRLKEATLEGRTIVSRLSNDIQMRVAQSEERFPIETSDLYARFFIECGIAKLLRHEMDLEHAAMTRNYWDQLSERKPPFWTNLNEIDAVATRSQFAAAVMRVARETYLAMETARIDIMPLLDRFWPSMMQVLACLRLRAQRYYALWSSTGSGKLSAALMAAKFIDARRTLVLTSEAKVSARIVEARMAALFGDTRSPERDEDEADRNQFVIVSYEQLRTLQDIEQYAQTIDLLVLDQAELAVENRSSVALLRQSLSENAYVFALCATPTAPRAEGVHKFVSIVELLCGSSLDGVVDSENDYALAFAYAHLYGFYYETPVSVSEEIVEAKIVRQDEKNYDLIAEYLRQTSDNAVPTADVVSVLQPYKKLAVARAIGEATTSVQSGRKEREDATCGETSVEKVLVYTSFVGTHCSILDDIVAAVREQHPAARIGCACGTHGQIDGDAEAISRFLLHPKNDRAYDVLIGTRLDLVDEVQCVCKRLVLYTLPASDTVYESLCGTLTRWGQQASEILVYIPRCVLVEEEAEPTIARLAYEDVFLQRLRRQARVRNAVLAGSEAPSEALCDGTESSIGCNNKKAALAIVLALLQRVWSGQEREEDDNAAGNAGNNVDQSRTTNATDGKDADGESMVRAQAMLDSVYDRWLNFTRKDLYEQCIERPERFWRPFHLLRDTVLENREGHSHPAHAVAMYIQQRRNRDVEEFVRRSTKQSTKEALCVADIGCGRKPVLAAALVHLFQGDEAVQVVSTDLYVEEDMRQCIVQAEASTISNEDLPDNEFDFVVCCQSLMACGQHMAAMVSRLRRALRYERGNLIIVQPTKWFLAKESAIANSETHRGPLEVGLMQFDRQMAQLGMISAAPPVFFGDRPEFALLTYGRFGSATSVQKSDTPQALCYPSTM